MTGSSRHGSLTSPWSRLFDSSRSPRRNLESRAAVAPHRIRIFSGQIVVVDGRDVALPKHLGRASVALAQIAVSRSEAATSMIIGSRT